MHDACDASAARLQAARDLAIAERDAAQAIAASLERRLVSVAYAHDGEHECVGHRWHHGEQCPTALLCCDLDVLEG